MSEEKPSLFESDVSEDEGDDMNINFENRYAQKYNDWRRKEEMQRLKDKYGESLDIMSEIEDNSGEEDGEERDDDDDSESESSNVESEDEDFDEQFTKVLTALKSKDPKIYEKEFHVKPTEDDDEDDEDDEQVSKKKSPVEKKMTLPEYHRKLIKEKKGITEEDEGLLDEEVDEDNKPPGYFEELYNIRREIKDIVKGDGQVDEQDEDEEVNMFSVKGQSVESASAKKVKQSEVDLAQIWSQKKKSDKSDEFLRDYIVNKRYAETSESLSTVKRFAEPATHFGGFENHDDEEEDPEDQEEEVDNEEKTLSKKATEGVTVSKYHFEEPDANVIKRFPRNVQSIRDTIAKDTKTKRAEVRDRKKQEKESELKKMRRFKREEIESRISKLKDISGNKKLDMKDLDLNVIIDDDNDFDMEKYDEKMNALFGDEYYNVDDEAEKPEFDYCEGIDDDLYPDEDELPKCVKEKKWKKGKDNKRDIMKDDDIGIYEDLIGGEIATRFRYRMVETNDFGLTDEEILFADDKELNRWCSLKKMSQYRSKGEEENDKHNFGRKKDNLDLKQRILKSLYGEEAEENPIIKAFSKGRQTAGPSKVEETNRIDDDREDGEGEPESSVVVSSEAAKKKKKKRGKKKRPESEKEPATEEPEKQPVEQSEEVEQSVEEVDNDNEDVEPEIEPEQKEIVEPKKPQQNNTNGGHFKNSQQNSNVTSSNNNRKRKRAQNNGKFNNGNNRNSHSNNNKKNNVGNSGLTESRLKAYGMSNRDIKRVKF